MPAYGSNGQSAQPGGGCSYGMYDRSRVAAQPAVAPGIAASRPVAGLAQSNGAQGGAAYAAAGFAAGTVGAAQAAGPRYIGPDGFTYVVGPDGALYCAVEREQQRKRRGPLFWAIILVALLCLAGAGWLAWSMLEVPAARQGDLGDLSAMSDAQIQEQIDNLIRESMFNISIASQVDFADGQAEGELKIENPASNAYLMRVSIVVEDTGQVIYETGVIEPNHHIERDRLAVDLPAGSYDCVARFSALDPQTEAQVGQASAKLKVNVTG